MVFLFFSPFICFVFPVGYFLPLSQARPWEPRQLAELGALGIPSGGMQPKFRVTGDVQTTGGTAGLGKDLGYLTHGKEKLFLQSSDSVGGRGEGTQDAAGSRTPRASWQILFSPGEMITPCLQIKCNANKSYLFPTQEKKKKNNKGCSPCLPFANK